MPLHITPELRQQIESHITSDMRGADVATKFDVADCTVSKIWKEYTAKTGIKHKRKYEVLKKMTHEQVEELKQHAHESSEVLAKKYKVSSARIKKILRDNGLGSNGSGKGHRLTDTERQQIIDAYGTMTPTEAASNFKVSYQTLATLWKKRKEECPDIYLCDARKVPPKRTKYQHNPTQRRNVTVDELESTEKILIQHNGTGYGKRKNYKTFNRKQLYAFLTKCSGPIDTNSTDCIRWIGCTTIQDGHMHAKITLNGVSAWVHTCSYVNFVGPLPDIYPSHQAMICHRCIDAGDCVNPKHLYLGTEDDNTKDRGAHEQMKKLSPTQQQEIIMRQDVPLWKAYRDWSAANSSTPSNSLPPSDSIQTTQQDIRDYMTK